MDVACSRCRAEYEFDDALISERGTTVFCTSCGHQFKIYPAERRNAPEEWTLTPAVPGVGPRTFGSLRELQRAILDGDVRESDLLARGGEKPRTLGSIAELESLLKRPRSAPPPARAAGTALGLGAFTGGPGQRRTAGGTVMGLAAPRVPKFAADSPPVDSLPPPLAAARQTGSLDLGAGDDAIVPSSPREDGQLAAEEPWHGAPVQTLRPKIQSVLNRSPAVSHPPESSASGPSSSSRLRDKLASSAPITPPGGRSQRDSSPGDRVSDAPPARPSRFDSEPFSVIPGTRPRPLARGAWIVVSVLVGATAFALTAARQRVFALFDDGKGTESSAQLVSAERALSAAVELADLAWLRARMASESERPAAAAALDARLAALEQALNEGARGPLAKTDTWTEERVHFLRMKGDVPAARAALGQAKGAPIVDPYLLGMLDLADDGEPRAFASILRRLKDASAAERGSYRMRSAYILALVEAGQLDDARADFARLAQNGDATNAPLYGDLVRFLEARSKATPAPAKGAQ